MWLSDLAKMLDAIKEKDGNLTKCIKSVKPAYDGIVIETTYFTFIKYNPHTGELIEKPAHECKNSF